MAEAAAENTESEGRKIVLRVKRKYTEDPVDALCKFNFVSFAFFFVLSDESEIVIYRTGVCAPQCQNTCFSLKLCKAFRRKPFVPLIEISSSVNFQKHLSYINCKCMLS